MDSKHVNLIRCNLEELVDVTKRVDDIIEKLQKQNILNSSMVKYLMMSTGQRKRLRNFYEMIQGRGPTAFDKLKSVLRETENFTAEMLLMDDSLNAYQYAPVETKASLINDIEDVFDGVVDSKLIVKIHPDGKFMDNDEENLPGGTYHMRSKPRGHALIINIYKTLNNRDRFGSEVDEKKLNKLFTELGYKVASHSNLKLKEMQDIIQDFSSNPELSTVDNSIVFIMSHGKQAKQGGRLVDLITSDGRNLSTEWIVNQFFSTTSKFTKPGERKPKLFFFQACRTVEDEARIRVNMRRGDFMETDSVPVSNGQCEDTWQIFSTSAGHPSMRDRASGAWFVNKFCEIVAENAWNYDLDTMLGMVHEKVRNLSGPFGHQTLEVVKQGVSKKLFFNPGL